MKIQYEGKFTSGYYNIMENGYPVFIDGEPVDDIIKDTLERAGLDSQFSYWGYGGPDDVKNPLIGKNVKLILEIED